MQSLWFVVAGLLVCLCFVSVFGCLGYWIALDVYWSGLVT